MNRVIGGIALVALGFGVKYIIDYASSKRGRYEQREALQTWEGEGGAVPVAPGRTAAQVLPHPERSGIADATRG